MTERERLLSEIKIDVSELPKGGTFDSLAAANTYCGRYNIPVQEIEALIIEAMKRHQRDTR